MFDIVSMGELLIDFTESGLSPAGMRVFERNAGGAVANLAAAAVKCGAKAALIAKVGADMHGRFLKQALMDAGVDVRNIVETEDAFTTLAFVALAPNGGGMEQQPTLPLHDQGHRRAQGVLQSAVAVGSQGEAPATPFWADVQGT